MRRKIKDFAYRLSLSYIMLLMAFMLGDVVSSEAMDDRVERISSNGSYAFNPGYVNAAKQKTAEIVKQLDQRKTFLESATEFVQNKLAGKVAEVSNNKEFPDLKMKTSQEPASAQDGSAGEAVSPMLPPDSIDPTVAAKMMSDAIKKGATITTLSNGNAINMWTDRNGQYFSVTDKLGKTIIEQQKIERIRGSQWSYASEVIDVGSGKFLIKMDGQTWNNYSWYGYSYSSGNSIQELRIYNADGIVEKSQQYHTYYYSGNYFGSSYYSSWGQRVSNITSIGDGNLVMSVDQQSYSSSRYYNYYSTSQYVRIVENGFTKIRDHLINRNYGFGNMTGYYNNSRINGIASLGDGKFVVAISSNNNYPWMYNGTLLKVMDKDGKVYANNFVANSYLANEIDYILLGGRNNNRMVSLGDGRFAVAWNYYAKPSNNYYGYPGPSADMTIKVDIFSLESQNNARYSLAKKSSEILGASSEYFYTGSSYGWNYKYVTAIKGLDNGSVVIALNGATSEYDYATKKWRGSWSTGDVKVINKTGSVADIKLGDFVKTNRSISQITTLGGGNFGVIMSEAGKGQTVKQFSSNGAPISLMDLDRSTTIEKVSKPESKLYAQDISGSDSANKEQSKSSVVTKAIKKANAHAAADSKISSSHESVLDGTDGSNDRATRLGTDRLIKLFGDAIKGKDIFSSYGIFAGENAKADAMSALSGILNNPTEDQAQIIDTVSILLADVKKIEDASMSPESLKKASDELMQTVATALLAQALPDLLGANDVSSMKNIFSDLGNVNKKVMLQYQESTKPYYEEVKKALTQNVDALQQQNILSKSVNKAELDKLSRSEIGRIIEKIRNSGEKTFEVEYILQQEAKYKQRYVEPNKKLLEENIKSILNDFTRRLNSTLNREKK